MSRLQSLHVTLIIILLALTAAGLLWLNRQLDETPHAGLDSPAPGQEAVPLDRRFSGLDTPIATGVQLPGGFGIVAITADSLRVRKKKIAFFRLPAFNEVVVANLRLVVNADDLRDSKARAMNRLQHDPHSASTKAIAKAERALANVFQGLVLPPARPPQLRVSGLIIEGLALAAESPTAQDLDLLTCQRAQARLPAERFSLALTDVVVCDSHGQRMLTHEAKLHITPQLRLQTETAQLIAAGSTQQVRSVSFALMPLLAGQKLESLVLAPTPSGQPGPLRRTRLPRSSPPGSQ